MVQIVNHQGRRWWTGDLIEVLEDGQIFVAGTNPEGRHGAGAAKAAMKFGLIYGKGRGLMGQSYGLITKNLKKGTREVLDNGDVIVYDLVGERSIRPWLLIANIEELYTCARRHTDKDFIIVFKDNVRNRNGYTTLELVEFFKSTPIPENIVFHKTLQKHFPY